MPQKSTNNSCVALDEAAGDELVTHRRHARGFSP